MKKIFVIGSGVMGLDIAQVFARTGYDVLVRDISNEIITAAQTRLSRSLDKLVGKGKMDDQQRADILAHIRFTTELKDGADCDLVVEAISEVMETKEKLFRELDMICPKETIFTSNTSSISVSAVAATTSRPDRFIGMHFFNPATVMKLVEVVPGGQTSDETVRIINELAVAIGKTPVPVKESPGFIVNRILIPMINEACEILDTGVAAAADIDTAMKLGAGQPMGPLALGDLVGLDVCLAILDTMFDETHDPKYRASLLLRKMVRTGRLGRKCGEGFYKYE
ncbi:MAG: 3-hydroxyacyl-CoA dehydrogenase NAD-binding domain-containing protein [Oscillospiraceae bacterium]|nr:3-hydroxyacyl-CoA dehydrogenase NAD-binding domain-containing protein [Oscillospiraceae bacterium]